MVGGMGRVDVGQARLPAIMWVSKPMTQTYARTLDHLARHLDGDRPLAAISPDVRLGGIYSLERIARDSAAQRPAIAQILAAYVRAHSPWPPTLPGQYVPDAPLASLPDLRTCVSERRTFRLP